MRELAYIETIKALRPIKGADNIECAEVLGFELVVKKGDFKVGDLCVYTEVDSILPELPPFEFLRSRKFRIRTIKLRQQISQGIAFPLSIINQVDPSFDLSKIKIGMDLTDTLKIVKFDPEAALDLPEAEAIKKSWIERKLHYYKWKLFGIKPIKRGDFPSDCPKTDEIRVQKMGGALFHNEGKLAYISEKCEGTSFTCIYRRSGNWLAKLFGSGYTIQLCSRNRIIFNSQKDKKCAHHIYDAVQRFNMFDGLKKLNRNIAIQGECIGPKIQGNIYQLKNLEIRVFLMYDIDTQTYLSFAEMKDICEKLGLPMVPIVSNNTPIVNDIKHYVELSKGKSAINPSVLREGIVIRLLNENVSFKSVNPEYLLSQELTK
jgi:hypothetical protein